MARVALEGVSKVFPGDVTAVDRIDLAVNDRELLVLVGPSGCGKSTTLRLIAGLETVSDGKISIGEQIVNDSGRHVAPKDRNIAMVFQNYALYPHMSVYNNMAFGLKLRYGGGWLNRLWLRLTNSARAAELAKQRQGIPAQIRQASEMLGIEHLLERMPRQLSGGERQRVALGRAIVRKPAAFLFDEPLSNLDAKLRVETRRELKRLHGQLAATMIYVTHDQVEAMTLGERIVVMDHGRVQQIGRPIDVYDRPRNKFVASFIGTPPMNFIEGRIDRNDKTFCFLSSGLTLNLNKNDSQHWPGEQLDKQVNRAVVLGVRPENVATRRTRSSQSETGANLAKVVDVELLGDSTLLHLEIGGQSPTKHNPILARTESRTQTRPGDFVEIELDATRVHLFDSQTGDNLNYTESE